MTADLARFIGVPFAEHTFDCWQLARAVLRECAGLALPDYGRPYADMGDHATIESNIREGLADGWSRVTDPRAWDLVIFNIAGQPRHIGVMLGPTKFLHVPEGQTSRIERIDDRMWAKRCEGFYRHG